MTATVEVIDGVKEHPTKPKKYVLTIGGKTYVTQESNYVVGDTCIVIHSNSILPDKKDWKKYNKLVREQHSYGVKSYGIVRKNKKDYSVGTDVSNKLGITEYQGYLIHNKKGECREPNNY